MATVLFVGGAIVWAIYTILGRWATQRFHAAAITFLSAAIGAIAFLPLSLVFEPGGFGGASAGPRPRRSPASLYLGTFGTVLSFVFFYLGVEQIGSARASAYAVLIPLFGVAAAVTVLGEALAPLELAGAALVIVGLRMLQSGVASPPQSARARVGAET